MGYDHAIGTNGAVVSLSVPKNTSFIMVNGTIGPENGVVSVEVSPQPESLQTQAFASYNPYESLAKIFMTPLDPTVLYSLSIRSDIAGNNNSAFGTDKIGLYTATFLGIRWGTTVVRELTEVTQPLSIPPTVP